MSAGSTNEEQRRRFEASEKIAIADTPLRRPALRLGAAELRAHFASEIGRAAAPLDNPHIEPRISDEQRATAAPASVLLAVLLNGDEPTVLVTQRHHGISFPGHWVFPGGRRDGADASPIETALREAEEEIGLERSRVEVLGRLGDYVSHSGFRIAPVVGLVDAPGELVAQPDEVASIAEISLAQVLDSSAYLLYRFDGRSDRAHFALQTDRVMLTGVTASICIGLYSELLRTLG